MAATMRSPAKGSTHPDPVGEMHFIISLPGLQVGQFQECSGLSAEVEVKEYPECGRNDFVHRLPTRIKYGNLTLKRGVTFHDALLRWFFEARTRVHQIDVTVSLLGPGAEEVRTWG